MVLSVGTEEGAQGSRHHQYSSPLGKSLSLSLSLLLLLLLLSLLLLLLLISRIGSF